MALKAFGDNPLNLESYPHDENGRPDFFTTTDGPSTTLEGTVIIQTDKIALGKALSDAIVSIYDKSDTELGKTQTDSNGKFYLKIPEDKKKVLKYLTIKKNNKVVYKSRLDPKASSFNLKDIIIRDGNI